MNITWIDGVLKGGAIILALFVLLHAWQASKAKTVSLARLSLIKITMIFSVVLILSFGVLEIIKGYLDRENSIEAINNIGSQALLGTLFEPQRINNSDTFKYISKAPNGFYVDVERDPIFQDFSTNQMVLRLWADPRYNESYIKANRSKQGESLSIEFVRQGWGCDVTVKQKNNKTTDTIGFRNLAIRLSVDTKMIERANQQGAIGIAFRVRVIDGRNNHWSWGKPFISSGIQSAKYSEVDSKGNTLMLEEEGEREFSFDISSREHWAVFQSDGGIAPVQSSSERFRFIQAVVIEPGFAYSKQVEQENKNDDPYQHNKKIGNSILGKDGKYITGRLSLHKVYFRE